MKETHPQFAGFGNKAGRDRKGIGGHHSARSATDDWLTPPSVIEALGGWQSFDLDPCAPEFQPYPTARRTYTIRQNGLILPWSIECPEATAASTTNGSSAPSLFSKTAMESPLHTSAAQGAGVPSQPLRTISPDSSASTLAAGAMNAPALTLEPSRRAAARQNPKQSATSVGGTPPRRKAARPSGNGPAAGGFDQATSRARIFLNPPYSPKLLQSFMARMAQHGRGTALIFARTETDAFFRFVWDEATAVLFLRGRINFHFGQPWTDEKTGKTYAIGDRAPANSGAPSVLIAYGMDDADILAAGRLDGQFVPLRIPRSVLAGIVETMSPGTWRDELERWMADRDGPVTLPELYSAFASHPKARGNPHYREKLRQELQRNHRRVARGLWERGNDRTSDEGQAPLEAQARPSGAGD